MPTNTFQVFQQTQHHFKETQGWTLWQIAVCIHTCYRILSHGEGKKKVTLYEYMFLYLMCMTSWYYYL